MRLWVLGVLAMFSIGACSSSTTNEAATGGSGGAAGMGGSGGTSTGGASTGGSAGSGGAGGAVGGTAGSDGGQIDGGSLCPSGKKGPALVAIGQSHCMDATEVTNFDYHAFIDSIGSGNGDLTGLSACAAVTSYQPATSTGCPAFAQGADQNFPVRCVDWCSAYAYCKWAGKRLCGKIPTGAALPSDAAKAENQWYAACAGPGAADKYFYGSSHEAGWCADDTVGTVQPVASFAKCESFYYPPLRDMLGNVAEWEDACDNPQAEASACNVRGGSIVDADASASCGATKKRGRTEHPTDVGFRCCWDASVK